MTFLRFLAAISIAVAVSLLLGACSAELTTEESVGSSVSTSLNAEPATTESAEVAPTITQPTTTSSDSSTTLVPTVVLSEIDNAVVRNAQQDGTLEQHALWLFDQLPVTRLAVSEGEWAESVFAINQGAVVEIATPTGFVSTDGTHLFVSQSTPAQQRTDVTNFEGQLVCTVPTSASETIPNVDGSLTFGGVVQTASENRRLVYQHQYDFDCSTGTTTEVQPTRLDPPDGDWQETYRLVRVGDREFLAKQIPNTRPITNEEGLRIDGSGRTGLHEFSMDGSTLVHVTTTSELHQVQARNTTSGELLWEVVLDGTVDEIDVVGQAVIVDGTDTSGVDGFIVVDLTSGAVSHVVETSMRLVGSS